MLSTYPPSLETEHLLVNAQLEELALGLLDVLEQAEHPGVVVVCRLAVEAEQPLHASQLDSRQNKRKEGIGTGSAVFALRGGGCSQQDRS